MWLSPAWKFDNRFCYTLLHVYKQYIISHQFTSFNVDVSRKYILLLIFTPYT